MNFPNSEEFDWNVSGKFKPNSRFKTLDGAKVYCHEPYADELYKKYEATYHLLDGGSKDLIEGSVYKCRIMEVYSDRVLAQTGSGQTIYIDLKKELKDATKLGIDGITFNIGEEVNARVKKTNGGFSGSVVEYYIHTLRAELFDQIKKESSAYLVKVVSVNKGGYIADLSGIKCFLPGSLAAANKITDFESYIGKTLHVMIEGYVQAKDIFIVSYKKYLNKIMDSKIQELDLTKKYRGYVTGTSDFGVFVEWDSVYTGLIHKTEFQDESYLSDLTPGSEVEFYVKEIKENNRLTLTLDKPLERNIILQDLENKIKEGTSDVYEAKIKHKRKNGALVEIESLGLMALIPHDRLGKKAGTSKPGDILEVTPYEVDPLSGKIFVQLVNVG
jgi:ribosomal protein S1